MKFRKALFLIPLLLFIGLACSLPGIADIMASETPLPTRTQPPTLTAAPPATAIPTNPPAPTDESAAVPLDSPSNASGDEDVFIVLDNTFSIDEWDTIVGLVQNDTDKTINWVEITILLYDDNDQLIATETTYPFLEMIPAGDTAPFSIYSDQWSAASTYDFLVEWEETDDLPAPGLEFISYTSYSDDQYLNIVGEVRNNSTETMGWVKIAAALYAEDGTLLIANYTYSMLDYIPPGGKSPFKVWFGENWEEGDNYEIQVQGDYDSMPEQVVQLVDSELVDDDGWCTINGSIRNNGSAEIIYATIIVAFYDAQNNILDAEWNFSDGDSIPAGATDTFEVTSYNCPDYDHYEIIISN